MATSDEILNGIDQLAELAEQERSGPDITTGDMVTFSGEGGEMTGVVESIEHEMANVRIMALAGDNMEPTDDVEMVALDALSLANAPEGYGEENADEEEAPEDNPTDTPDEDEEEELEKGCFVAWDSSVGRVVGKVVDTGDDLILPESGDEIKGTGQLLIEVYQDSGGYEATGVHVIHPRKAVEAIDPVAVKMSRLMVKLKNYTDEEEAEGKVGVIEGLASAYGKVDLGGDTVQKGAYSQTLAHNDGKFQLMFDHGWGVKDVAGIAIAEDSDEGLKMRGEMPIHIASVREVYEKIKFMGHHGKPIGLSIGYTPVKTEPGRDGTRILKEIALHEISVTPYPMDTHARIRDAKSRKSAYLFKRKKWQALKPATPDAPTGNQPRQDDPYVSLVGILNEIKTQITPQ